MSKITEYSEEKQNALLELANRLKISIDRDHIRPNFEKLLVEICKKYRLKQCPRLIEVLKTIPLPDRIRISRVLNAKPIRTSSGIAVVSVMCKPHRCPHLAFTGNVCVYCPGGPDSDFEYTVQSYTGTEPTSMRAMAVRYDPLLQVKDRLNQFKMMGHLADKIEFVILGGTFMALPSSYRTQFIIGLNDALSGHNSTTLI
ncbi:hypothetical protein ACOME3_001835 [Neoechinorhynchus agilis]